jgi:hypothetical protein
MPHTVLQPVLTLFHLLLPQPHRLAPQVLLLCRLLVGGGLAGATVAHSLLMELLPAVGRGSFMVAVEPFWTVGTLVEALLAWRLLGGAGWRVLLLVSTAPLGGSPGCSSSQVVLTLSLRCREGGSCPDAVYKMMLGLRVLQVMVGNGWC